MLEYYLDIAARFVPVLATIAVAVVTLLATNWYLRRRWKDEPEAQFRFQLIMLALTFAGLLAVIVALPINDSLRGQLLSLIGILLSAAIALSSTTFIGNIMAGIMLKALRSARPGDFITVAELTGRITEMDLLHTEIQTEFRDLVTVPNLYMVTQPLQVVRASGTIISAEVSLGYDVPRRRVDEVLRDAASRCGLGNGFVQVRELGDFAVTYRVAGLLEDVKSLISARSDLRAAMVDALHEAGIEIVSPGFMNTRALREGQVFIPAAPAEPDTEALVHAEDVAFDKAEEAASLESIKLAIAAVDAKLEALDADKPEGAAETRAALEQERAALVEDLHSAEAAVKGTQESDSEAAQKET